ncbi:MAG: GTPase Era [Bdellovibrionales bacterium CG10_big_fil_rev_8_21_14_0_10_45_34]|nr:MAG: GTPase Era [Bdellovibrionales bacterium CG10_big_fil_rev_8_21_14_0_10_45_34]
MKRYGAISIIGEPNVGKSTLINALVGEKVSAVTHKAQTTRARSYGLMSSEEDQVLIVDTPGFNKRPGGLNHFLHEEILSSVHGVDVVVGLLSFSSAKEEKILPTLNLLESLSNPYVLLVNKFDQQNEASARFWSEFEKNHKNLEYISALKNPVGVKTKLLRLIEPYLHAVDEHPYGQDEYTLNPLKMMASELIRETCMEWLHKEIPYELAVRVLRLEDKKSLTAIDAQILVTLERHRPIVLGRGGQMIKKIGTQSRKKIEALVGRKLLLNLQVKVEPNWFLDERTRREVGFGSIV